MKAIRVHEFGEPSVLKLEEVPDPVPGPGQVLVRVRAAGVNPVETYIRRGIYGPKEFPYTPGQDAAGTVEAVGAGVKKVKPGDRVYTSRSITGTYAEKTLAPESGVHPLPEHVTFEQGAALGVPYGTAYRALFHRADPRAGETVLVHGASGGVGTAALQFARAFGLIVIGTAGSEAGRKQVLEQGAHHVYDHHAPDYLERMKNEVTGGRGVDIILEMLANVNLGKDLPILAPSGRVIVIGSRGPVEINARDTMGKNSDIRGMTLAGATEQDWAGIHQAIVAGLENRTLRPIVGRQFALADAAKAHVEVIEGQARGKIVLLA